MQARVKQITRRFRSASVPRLIDSGARVAGGGGGGGTRRQSGTRENRRRNYRLVNSFDSGSSTEDGKKNASCHRGTSRSIARTRGAKLGKILTPPRNPGRVILMRISSSSGYFERIGFRARRFALNAANYARARNLFLENFANQLTRARNTNYIGFETSASRLAVHSTKLGAWR